MVWPCGTASSSLAGGTAEKMLPKPPSLIGTTTTAANVYAVNISLTAKSEDTTLASYSPANRLATVEGRVRLRNE